METSKTNFVKRYEPGAQARVELKNGRILDVINGRYYDAGTSVILQGGKIESMPGLIGEPRVPVDFMIDLKGKTVIPSLFNTHLHLSMTGATMVAGLSDMRQSIKYGEQQKANNMAELPTIRSPAAQSGVMDTGIPRAWSWPATATCTVPSTAARVTMN